jgi:hypothetical protein
MRAARDLRTLTGRTRKSCAVASGALSVLNTIEVARYVR